MNGWTLTPIDPTPEMIDAGVAACHASGGFPDYIGAKSIYVSALSASPAFVPSDAQVEKVAREMWDMDYDDLPWEQAGSGTRAGYIESTRACIAAFLKAVAEG